MYRLAISSLLMIGLGVVASSAQEKIDPPKKAEPITKKEIPIGVGQTKGGVRIPLPGEVDIHFLNGSTVRMVIQSERLEVATAYGKLSVPVTDVRAIEFGLHFAEGIEAKIDAAVRSLGSSDFRERQRGADLLVELGPFSYPAALEASRVKDAEIGPRGKEIVKKLQANHPKKDLKIAVEDKVITKSFTIMGRILTPSLKATTEYFGDIELKLAKMRTMRAISALGLDAEIALDASKYANPGQWMETSFVVDGRTAVSITAKGLIDIWPQQGGQYVSGPNGFNATRGGGMPGGGGFGMRKIGAVNQNQHCGLLLGKIGEDGDIFIIGERFEATPETEGKLYLHIGPSQYNNSQSAGTYDVKITRKD